MQIKRTNHSNSETDLRRDNISYHHSPLCEFLTYINPITKTNGKFIEGLMSLRLYFSVTPVEPHGSARTKQTREDLFLLHAVPVWHKMQGAQQQLAHHFGKLARSGELILMSCTCG